MNVSTVFPTPTEVAALTPTQFKAVENKLRRAARRQGMELEKHRVKDPRAIGFGTYRLVGDDGKVRHQKDHKYGYGLTLHDVASILQFS
jgi:hypothetical protein